MGKHIALLGNSHTNGVRQALLKDPDLAGDLEITFFVSPGKGLWGLELKEGVLVPNTDSLRGNLRSTSGGLETLDPQQYDGFVLNGLNVFLRPITAGRYSAAVIEAAVQSLVVGTLGWKICEMLRKVSDKPIYFTHSPQSAMPVERHFAAHPEQLIPYQEMVGIAQKEFDRLNVRLVMQDHRTLHEDVLTRPEYRLYPDGNVVKDGVAGQDWRHMNADYGRIYLENMVRVVSENLA